jgi:hypothetical protein
LTIAAATVIQPSYGYVPSDYASDTVQAAVQELMTASGNIEQTFKAYENIAGIITEGKGVGGMVNYSKSSTLLHNKNSDKNSSLGLSNSS